MYGNFLVTAVQITRTAGAPARMSENHSNVARRCPHRTNHTHQTNMHKPADSPGGQCAYAAVNPSIRNSADASNIFGGPEWYPVEASSFSAVRQHELSSWMHCMNPYSDAPQRLRGFDLCAAPPVSNIAAAGEEHVLEGGWTKPLSPFLNCPSPVVKLHLATNETV